ncbi:hypothetical protein [Virgibacillus oceani]|uniref:Uncharacterized protein n=1 Tax=Virgibacillus oceani TaxID=1479511 RepID=A0A917GZF5_9BACI|nr:hypothetical protein [Virgibacillus oceani]GGG62648.1 hypothetical protein GCM10011398_02520 [Virgibacillus oceani]
MPRKVAVLTEQSTAGDKGNSGERKRIDVDLIVRRYLSVHHGFSAGAGRGRCGSLVIHSIQIL